MSKTIRGKIKSAIDKNLAAPVTQEMAGPTMGRNGRRARELDRLMEALKGRNKKGGTGGKKPKAAPVVKPEKKGKKKNG